MLVIHDLDEYSLTNKSELLKSWGNFKAHNINLSILGENNTEAVKIFDKAGWE